MNLLFDKGFAKSRDRPALFGVCLYTVTVVPINEAATLLKGDIIGFDE